MFYILLFTVVFIQSVSSNVSKCYKTQTQLKNFKSRVYFPFHEAVSISLSMEQRLNDNYGINCMNNKILQNSMSFSRSRK